MLIQTSPPLYKHQEETVEFLRNNDRALDFSDPGTGKTRPHLVDAATRKQDGGGKTLVLAPKSILYPAWGADIERFTPGMRYSIATATNRKKAFALDADIYITNHDAVTFLMDNQDVLHGFEQIIVDESTAFKHRSSRRSKFLGKLVRLFNIRRALSGTPNPNTILDLWHQALIIDDGEHLGNNFWKFRSTCCEPVQTGPGAAMIQWVDKEGIEDVIGLLIEDITIRHKFEECISIPPNTIRTVPFHLPPALTRRYHDMRKHALLELEDATVTPVHKAALRNKLLQIASGGVYDNDKVSHVFASERYELVAELVEERPQSIVAFNWKHQKEEIARLLTSRNIPFATIDGDASDNERNAAVADFQDGKLRTILAHPASAGHGLTLTKGVATIWASPTYNAEHFQQFNRRIYRSGQTEPTETLLIEAVNTIENEVYTRLQNKLAKMLDLLTLLQS